MPKGIYERKPRNSVATYINSQSLKDVGATAEPLYMELVIPPAGLVLKVLDNPQHVFCTLHISKEGISHAPSNGKKQSRMLTWHTVHQIAAVGLLTRD